MRQLNSSAPRGPSHGTPGLRREAVSTLWGIPSLHPHTFSEMGSGVFQQLHDTTDGSERIAQRNQLSPIKPDIAGDLPQC